MNRSKSAKKKKPKQPVTRKLAHRIPTAQKKKQKKQLTSSNESLESIEVMSEKNRNNGTSAGTEKTVVGSHKKEYIANKKIVMNMATDDNDNVSLLAAAPDKLDKVQNNMVEFSQKTLVVDHSLKVMLPLKGISFDPTLNLILNICFFQLITNLLADNIQFSPTSRAYMDTLLDEVHSFYIQDEATFNKEEELRFKIAKLQYQREDHRLSMSSLGVMLDDKQGVFLGIIKGSFTQTFSKFDHSLLKKNYMNLEKLAASLMTTGDGHIDPEQ